MNSLVPNINVIESFPDGLALANDISGSSVEEVVPVWLGKFIVNQLSEETKAKMISENIDAIHWIDNPSDSLRGLHGIVWNK